MARNKKSDKSKSTKRSWAKPKSLIAVRLDAELIQAMKHSAHERQMTMSAFVTEALLDLLEKE